MQFDERKALQTLERLIRERSGSNPRMLVEFSNWSLQLSQILDKAASPLGLSPQDEYERRRVYDGLTRLALLVGERTFPDLGMVLAFAPPDEKLGRARILFLAANPQDTKPLRLGEEIRAIDARLRSSDSGQHNFELIQHHAVRLDDAIEALLRHNPDIVHFSGHGSPTNEIIMEAEKGKRRPVSRDELVRLFRVTHAKARLVVLNACYTATQASAITEVVDSVVGMSRAVGDSAAIEFASGFYRGLAFKRSVQEAFDLGCYQISIDKTLIGEETTPVLLTKEGVKASDIYFNENP
jgi:hypothetical protein